MAENEFPRRNRLDKMNPAELAIYHAMQEVEKLGASEGLTKAIILLSEAKDLVSDFVDGEASTQESTPDQPPPVPPKP